MNILTTYHKFYNKLFVYICTLRDDVHRIQQRYFIYHSVHIISELHKRCVIFWHLHGDRMHLQFELQKYLIPNKVNCGNYFSVQNHFYRYDIYRILTIYKQLWIM